MSNNQTTPGETTPHQTIHMDTDTASDSEPNLQTGVSHVHTYISVDTDSEDGGMQLEPPDGEMLHFAEDDSDIEFDERIMGVAMEEDRDGMSSPSQLCTYYHYLDTTFSLIQVYHRKQR
ncbi:hypothetical protein PoHVEF18_003909 [Penicillium ochrochloron]